MTQTQDVQAWIGHTAVDQDGDKIGTIDEIYVDDASGQPEWLAVKTGMFGSKLTFVPLRGASRKEDDLCVSYTKAQVKDAPSVEPDGHLDPDEEQALYQHYGLEGGAPEGTGTGRDTSGPDTDDAMTRSEEELAVGTRSQEVGKVRLRKYVVTENVTTTVPVSHEEVRVEREPITDEGRAAAEAGADISEEEHEVTLHADEVVTDKTTVAKERVRLDKETVTEDQQVSDEVRKERIETDQDAGTSDR